MILSLRVSTISGNDLVDDVVVVVAMAIVVRTTCASDAAIVACSLVVFIGVYGQTLQNLS